MSGNPTTPSPAVAALNTAMKLQAMGLQVNSTSTPSLNGRYATTDQALAAMQQEVNAILLNQNFADGSASVNWPDMTNTGHAFDVAQFHALAVAVANFVVGCMQYGVGLSTTEPSTTATIA